MYTKLENIAIDRKEDWVRIINLRGYNILIERKVNNIK